MILTILNIVEVVVIILGSAVAIGVLGAFLFGDILVKIRPKKGDTIKIGSKRYVFKDPNELEVIDPVVVYPGPYEFHNAKQTKAAPFWKTGHHPITMKKEGNIDPSIKRGSSKSPLWH